MFELSFASLVLVLVICFVFRKALKQIFNRAPASAETVVNSIDSTIQYSAVVVDSSVAVGASLALKALQDQVQENNIKVLSPTELRSSIFTSNTTPTSSVITA